MIIYVDHKYVQKILYIENLNEKIETYYKYLRKMSIKKRYM